MLMSFKWHPDEAPPPVEVHSKAKLNVKPQHEEFKLDLIDGFAGG